MTRLQGKLSFGRVRQGCSVRGRLVSLRWVENELGAARVGIIVSRRVGQAVVRNRVRRRLREIVRQVPLPPRDLLLIASPAAAEADFWILWKDVRQLLGQVG
ncbi:MAG: ribonuclease P protein component [Deinococcus sp.]|nr:ribonuclease P protein component [Deinococcus sp.]